MVHPGGDWSGGVEGHDVVVHRQPLEEAQGELGLVFCIYTYRIYLYIYISVRRRGKEGGREMDEVGHISLMWRLTLPI